MEMTVTNGRYVFHCTYPEKETPKAAGFRWSQPDKVWYTDSPDTAMALVHYADDLCRAVLMAHQKGRSQALEASRSTTSTLSVPAPAGLEYMPFQVAGIEYMVGRPATLIADEMGLGKTIQVLGLINADESIKNILVICPNSLKLNWLREAQRWLVRPIQMTVLSSTDRPVMSGLVIVNYDIVSKMSALFERNWDLLVCDESHYLKNPKAQRTVWVLGGQVRLKGVGELQHKGITARRRLFLTGTPILNRPIELWPLVHSLDPEGLGKSWFRFATRYCGAYQDRWGWKTDGASNLEELQTKLRSSIMVRRLKRDVLKELPPKRRQVVVFDPETNEEKAMLAKEAHISQMAESMVEEAKMGVALAAADGDEQYKMAVDKLREVTGVAFSQISAVRHETAVCKIPRVAEFVLEALENVRQLVAFAHHHDVVDGLLKAMAEAKVSAVALTGRESPTERDEAVRDFQAGKARVFIGSIRAAGMGLTLTAASTVIFAELDWTPGMMTQAEDRCHRIGQEAESVHVIHLVYDESLDVRMARTLISKQAVADKALDTPVPVESEELPPLRDEPVAPIVVKVDKLGGIAAALSETDIELIHKALRRLDELCDGARAIDGMGFNKLDTRVGKELARRHSLSPRQAALGWLLARKYRRQLSDMLLPEIHEKST